MSENLFMRAWARWFCRAIWLAFSVSIVNASFVTLPGYRLCDVVSGSPQGDLDTTDRDSGVHRVKSTLSQSHPRLNSPSIARDMVEGSGVRRWGLWAHTIRGWREMLSAPGPGACFALAAAGSQGSDPLWAFRDIGAYSPAVSEAGVRTDRHPQLERSWEDCRNRVVVFVVDDGVRLDHKELRSRCANPDSAQLTAPNDPPEAADGSASLGQDLDQLCDHGTGVASSIVGRLPRSQGLIAAGDYGIAPDALVIPVEIDFDADAGQDGELSVLSFIAGLRHVNQVVAQQHLTRVIVSMSCSALSLARHEQELQSELQDLVDAGCLLVASAGDYTLEKRSLGTLWNYRLLPFDKPVFPACCPCASAAGTLVGIGSYGIRRSPGMPADCRQRWFASNMNARAVDFALPGVEIFRAHQMPGLLSSCSDGVSFSVGLFDGCAALVWQQWPELTAREVTEVLARSGSQRSAVGFHDEQRPALIDLSQIPWQVEDGQVPSAAAILSWARSPSADSTLPVAKPAGS